MRYFTPEKFVALQATEPAAMAAADAAWEQGVAEYELHLQRIRPRLSDRLLELLDHHHYHDADVRSMGRQENQFTIVLQLDPPPHELLTITYSLAGEPQIDREALPPRFRQSRPLWLHEELDVAGDGNAAHYLHSILLSNGREVHLTIRDVELTTSDPVFPLRGSMLPQPARVSHPA